MKKFEEYLDSLYNNYEIKEESLEIVKSVFDFLGYKENPSFDAIVFCSQEKVSSILIYMNRSLIICSQENITSTKIKILQICNLSSFDVKFDNKNEFLTISMNFGFSQSKEIKLECIDKHYKYAKSFFSKMLFDYCNK